MSNINSNEALANDKASLIKAKEEMAAARAVYINGAPAGSYEAYLNAHAHHTAAVIKLFRAK